MLQNRPLLKKQQNSACAVLIILVYRPFTVCEQAFLFMLLCIACSQIHTCTLNTLQQKPCAVIFL